MAQHPQYSNSPDKNLNDMYKLLFEMERFCIIHPNIYEQINTLMSSLYSNPESFNDEDDDTLPDGWDSPSDINDLWMNLDESDKEQFIQDLGHVIYGCMAGNIEDVDDILRLRNIDEYRENIRIDTDLATNQKYAHIKRTVWFPENEKPNKVGIYEVSSSGYESPALCGYASWNGENWSDSYSLLIDAEAIACIDKEHMYYNQHCWRGFSEKV